MHTVILNMFSSRFQFLVALLFLELFFISIIINHKQGGAFSQLEGKSPVISGPLAPSCGYIK